MRDWKLTPTDPLYLTLASDARLVPTDYCNDQIWEVAIGGGEPSGIAVQTTFGLRARSFRMFPMFSENDGTICTPSEFNNPPQLKEFYPNFLSLIYSPFSELDIQAEYWVPHSHGMVIRLFFLNHSNDDREIKLEWITQLSPYGGRNMAPAEIDNTLVLTGNSANLAPVVLFSGGAQAYGSPYPSFTQAIFLKPHETRTVMISFAAFTTLHDSFTAARHFLGRSWESEINRVRLLNAGAIEIYTGNPDWDAVFAFSQNLMNQLRINPQKQLPFPSFVLSRHPDQGHSLREDGLDYNHLWNGQPVLESYFLVSSLLPESAGFAKGLVRNYLSTQTAEGNIDWKPGVAGQRSQLLATPILCSLTWRIFQATFDKNFLQETFFPLFQFIKTWLNPQHDRDQDGIPEWDHVFQLGVEDHPVFSFNYPDSQGVDISTAESPALAAFLFRECQCLKEIGKILNNHDFDPDIDSIAQKISAFVNASWDSNEGAYLYRDRDTHQSTQGVKLAEQIGPGEILIQREFEQPVRISIHVRARDEKTRRVQVFIHGENTSGVADVERIATTQMRWNQGCGYLSGGGVYKKIFSIDIQGVQANDMITVFAMNYHFHDLTSFLPLWAGIPSAEQAKAMIEKSLLNPDKYFHPYGFSQFIAPPSPENDTPPQNINLIWTQLIGEGMLKYGYQKEVAQLFDRFMPSLIQSLKNEQAFREKYSAETGKGNGELNILSGVAPISLFLDTIGMRLYSSNKVALRGFTPFSWPVTVKYRGINVYKQLEKSTVIFPNGETMEIDDTSPKLISLE
jgi:hypothetical protein